MSRNRYGRIEEEPVQYCRLCGHRVYNEDICNNCKSVDRVMDRVNYRIMMSKQEEFDKPRLQKIIEKVIL